MKKIFTKAIGFVAAVVLFVGIVLPAHAQFVKGVYENNNEFFTALAKDPNGNIYGIRSADGVHSSVVKYALHSRTFTAIFNGLNAATGGFSETNAGFLPWGLAVNSHGDVYVTTDLSTGNTTNGTNVVNGVALGNHGNVIKLTSNNGYNGTSYSASVFLDDGLFYSGLAFDASDNLYVMQTDNTALDHYTVTRYPAGSTTGTELFNDLHNSSSDNYPHGIVVAPNLDIFVCDAGQQDGIGTAGHKGRVKHYVYSSAGGGTYPSQSSFPDNYPMAIALDPSGNLYVSETNGTAYTNYRLNKYNATTHALIAGNIASFDISDGIGPDGIAAVSSDDIYVLGGGNPSEFSELIGPATTAASGINFTATTPTTTTINWTNGDGDTRAVFVAATSTGTPSPANSTNYTANANFGSGSQAGAGWYCVYNGSGTSVNVTGLTTGNTYRAMVVEYNGSHIAGTPVVDHQNYLTTSNSGNTANVTALAGETITFNSLPTKTYGDANFSPGATSTNSNVTITYASDNSAVATIVGSLIHIVGQGTAHITASQLGDASHTAAADVVQLLTVNRAGLTITANNQTKIYGAALPALTVSYNGFTNGESSSVLTTAPTITTTATSASHVAGSPYSITASGASAANYTISYVAGSLSITPVGLTITANNQSKVYGAALPTLTASFTGFTNGDTGSSLTTPPTITTTATSASHVAGSPYAITASGAVDADYTISYVAGSLSVTPTGLTITANNQSKVYGAALPTLTASYTGFTNGDTGSSLTTAPTLSTTATSASHVAGSSYAITASGAVDADYTISYVAGSLAVTATGLTITANNQTKVYGDALPTLTASYTGFTNGDTGASLTTAPTLTTTATSASHVAGSPYAITASGAVDADYTISYVAGSLAITPVGLTITANNQTKVYGDALPTLTASFTGFTNGDTGASLTTAPTLTTTATSASHVAGSPYAITASGAVDADYTISYVAGSLAITPVGLTITANNQTKVYGDALPTLTASYTGFTNGDTGASLTTAPTLSTTATSASHVAGSPYAITASGAVDADYTISYVAGSLAVTTASLNVIADNQTKVYGDALPTLTASYTGFTNGDTEASLTTLPTVATTATSASTVAGSPYAITASGAVDSDYGISYTAGSLSVTTANLTITANDQTMVHGSSLPTLTASFTGFTNGDNAGSLTAQPILITTATSASAPGPYPITASGAADDNYSISYVQGTLTVTPKTNANLATLTTTANGFAPTFDPNVTTGYTANVPNATTTITVTPTPADVDANAKVQVNGGGYTLVSSGMASDPLTLHSGDNTIDVQITAEDGTTTKTYTLTVTQLPLPTLTSLGLSSATNPAIPITTVSGSNYADYTAIVPYATSQVMITPTAVDGRLTVKVGAETVLSGSTSSPVDLNEGQNTIATTVTDGGITNTYSITVTRAAANLSADAGLAQIAVNPRTLLTPVSGPGIRNYTITVPNSQASLTVTATFTEPNASMTVNGTVALSAEPSQPVALNVGENLITIVVTAQDGASIKTYYITAIRGGSPVATLASVALSSGILSPVFAPETSAYSAVVTNATSSITLTPAVTEPNATIKVTGATVASGAASASQPLTVGTNTITTVVTAQDGTTTQAYTVTVTRAAANLSTNAGLSGIKVNPNTTLTTVSGPGTLNYTTAIPNSQTSLTVTTTVAEPHATIKVNGAAAASGAASQPITLGIGDNVINVVVTAQDGATIKNYIITATRAGTPIVTLSNLALNTGILSPVFASATTDYSAIVPNATSSVTITPTVTDINATIQLNGVAAASGAASAGIPLNVGANTITTVVTAQDGSINKTYTVTVTRAAAALSANAGLASIRLNPVTALTTVSGPGTINYTAAIPNSQTSLTVTAITSEAHATMKINGTTATSGTASQSIPLNIGNNVITVVVTAQDGASTKSFIVTATRAASTVATLANLALSTGTLNPVFASATIGYTAIVPNAVSSIKITPIVTNATATIKVNGAAVTSGMASANLPLTAGTNTITTVVTAQDGTTTKTYTVTVTRAAAGLSTNAGLANIKLTPNTPLTTVSGPGNANYTTPVPYSETSVTVTPTAAEAHAAIKVNGTTVSSGVASQSIPLNVGDNVINIIVTAQDGATVRSYIITATRAASSLLAQYDAPADNLKADGITVHQGVSPNGDGDNDVLTIEGIAAYPDNRVIIMNRSGALVFEAKGYNNASVVFDGHSNKNGRLQQAGTYFYSLDYKDGKESKHKTGFILLKY